MGSEETVIGYREGEVFRPHRFLWLLGAMIAILNAGLVVLLIRRGIYFPERVEEPIIQVGIEPAIITCYCLVGVWFTMLSLYGFVRISNEGINCRLFWRVARIRWEEITAVEFKGWGKQIGVIRLHRGGAVKPLKLRMGLFQKELRARMVTLVRERVPVELQIERKIGWWGLKVEAGRGEKRG